MIQTFSKKFRILKRDDFSKNKEQSSLFKSKYFLVFYNTNKLTNARLGLKISRFAGNAIVRNKIKRLIRENFRKSEIKLKNIDLVFVINKRAFNESINRELLNQDIKYVFEKLMSYDIS